MIDIQIYKDNKEIFHRHNMDFDFAHIWLKEKEDKVDDIDNIDIQVFTWEDMPVDSVENLRTFQDAHEWLHLFIRNYDDGLYHRMKIIR